MRAGEEVVLVGTGEHGVTAIRRWTEAEARSLGLIHSPGAIEQAGLPVVAAPGAVVLAVPEALA